jgi:carboxymethylenebutenolidase
MQTAPQTVAHDVASAVAYLRNQVGNNPQAIFTMGFCFGGRNSFMQAANHLGLSGVIGFYGALGAGRMPGPRPADLASQYECPVLGLFGGADEGIPQTQIDEFDQALSKAGVEHRMVAFPGAPHSFFDRKQEQFAKESAEAWRLTLQFIADHTPR